MTVGFAVRRRDESFERPLIAHAKSLIPAAPFDIRSRIGFGIEIGPLAQWRGLRVHAGPRMHDPPALYQKTGVAGSRMRGDGNDMVPVGRQGIFAGTSNEHAIDRRALVRGTFEPSISIDLTTGFGTLQSVTRSDKSLPPLQAKSRRKVC
jgi:hypothetical protein